MNLNQSEKVVCGGRGVEETALNGNERENASPPLLKVYEQHHANGLRNLSHSDILQNTFLYFKANIIHCLQLNQVRQQKLRLLLADLQHRKPSQHSLISA